MFQIIGLDHIVLNTTKLNKMVDFYCNVLGCQIEKVEKEYHLTQLRAGDSLIDLIDQESQSSSKSKNLNHFCLRISPFNREELQSYFDKKNVEIQKQGERYGAQGMGYSLYVQDPEGNSIELKASHQQKR